VLSLAFGSYMSSSSWGFFFPHILHATYAKAPTSAAPTTPTTTPIIVFLEDELRPELPEPLLLSLRPATDVEVALIVDVNCEAELVVTTDVMTCPLLVVVKDVTTGTKVLPVSLLVKTDVTSEAEDGNEDVRVDVATDTT